MEVMEHKCTYNPRDYGSSIPILNKKTLNKAIRLVRRMRKKEIVAERKARYDWKLYEQFLRSRVILDPKWLA